MYIQKKKRRTNYSKGIKGTTNDLCAKLKITRLGYKI